MQEEECGVKNAEGRRRKVRVDLLDSKIPRHEVAFVYDARIAATGLTRVARRAGK